MGMCEQLTQAASGGVAPALRAVDCVAGEMTGAAFGRLFGAGGAMAPALIILLTLYIAFFAISLLTGRSSLGISALTPRMLTLGLVLTFATSWIAYQSVVWNLAVGGPDWIASMLMGAKGSATELFGNRIDIVFNVIAERAGGSTPVQAAAGAQAAAASGGQSGQGLFSPESVLWLGALLLLLGTVGVLLTARIALAVLMALGPVFVVMALFSGTRGLTAGWLRGVVLTALTPLFVVLAGSITLELLVPIVRTLTMDLNEIDGRAAMALFVVAAVHMALMVMVLKVAGTMVSGWQVFGLASGKAAIRDGAQPTTGMPAPFTYGAAAEPGLAGGSRRSALAAAIGAQPLEVTRSGDGLARSGERRAAITHVSGGGLAPIAPDGVSRARGIGSRFRSASNDTGRRMTSIPSKEMIR
jgi:type IV secretion system protein VirB6